MFGIPAITFCLALLLPVRNRALVCINFHKVASFTWLFQSKMRTKPPMGWSLLISPRHSIPHEKEDKNDL